MEFLLYSFEKYTKAFTFCNQLKDIILYEFSSEDQVIHTLWSSIKLALDPKDPCNMAM